MDNKIPYVPPDFKDYVATEADRENDRLLQEWRERRTEEARVAYLLRNHPGFFPRKVDK